MCPVLIQYMLQISHKTIATLKVRTRLEFNSIGRQNHLNNERVCLQVRSITFKVHQIEKLFLNNILLHPTRDLQIGLCIHHPKLLSDKSLKIEFHQCLRIMRMTYILMGINLGMDVPTFSAINRIHKHMSVKIKQQ